MASSSKLSHPASASSTGAPAALPADALFEVLLRLPAKELCRLRVVCRAWRALTSDPHFVAEHKSRHAEPLFAVAFSEGDVRGVAIVSLSGQVLRRIPLGTDSLELLLTHLDRLCVYRWCKPSLAAWILNPATAVAITLPGLNSDEFLGTCAYFTHNCMTVTYAFGQVASTGDYKVLRISHPHPTPSHPQLCDIMTLDGSSQGRWRTKHNPPSDLWREGIMDCIAFNGIVYFLLHYVVSEPNSIAPFHLDTEKWMPTLQGPEPLRSGGAQVFGRNLSLANLNGSLVVIDNDVRVSFDLWFLMNHNTDLWVKKYRLSIMKDCYGACPLLIRDDGRIIIYDRVMKVLQFYDPTTDSLADVLDFMAMGLGDVLSIGVYTGSLLI